MSFVWTHPSLTGLEVCWRWLAIAPMFWLGGHVLGPVLAVVPLDLGVLGSLTVFEPVRSAHVLAAQLGLYLPVLAHTGRWWIPLALAVWVGAAGVGRAAIVRRADRLWRRQRHPSASPEPDLTKDRGVESLGRLDAAELARSRVSFAASTALFSLVRALAFLALLAVWFFALFAAARSALVGTDPNLVLFTAEAVGITVAAFLLWSLTVWALDLRWLEGLTHVHSNTHEQKVQLRSKLTETNLVLGIVRVILFVLAMTFSASPLPFQSQETQAYINVWWSGVAVFYVLSSDFFHVVRRVTYLRLLQSIAI